MQYQKILGVVWEKKCLLAYCLAYWTRDGFTSIWSPSQETMKLQIPSFLYLLLLFLLIPPQKMNFSIKDWFSKWDEFCRKVHSSYLLKKSLMENFIFCAVFTAAGLHIIYKIFQGNKKIHEKGEKYQISRFFFTLKSEFIIKDTVTSLKYISSLWISSNYSSNNDTGSIKNDLGFQLHFQ